MENIIQNALFIISFLIVLNHATVNNNNNPKAVLYSLKEVDSHWSSFKKSHNRQYKNNQDEVKRKSIFQSNLDNINKLNAKYLNNKITYVSGITQFTDLTPNEFMDYVKKGYGNNKMSKKNSNLLFSGSIKTGKSALPASVDWRTKGVVNAIKNQGQCGSCWAFSALGTVESMSAIVSGQLPLLSEQNLVDCTGSFLSSSSLGTSADGCQGGFEEDAMNYMQKNGGINTAATYPYTSATSGVYSGKCRYNITNKSNTKVTGYVALPIGNETALQQALANIGPISVAIEVTNNFQNYISGLFKDTTCRNTPNFLNHAVILVGYDTDANGNQYYILRNSWGISWGMNGYMQFARNNKNMCGIATNAIYPNVLVGSSITTTKLPSLTTTTKLPSTTTKTTKSLSTTRSPSTGLCTDGNQYGTYPGCSTYYNCAVQITAGYFCQSGNLFDTASQLCKPSSQVTCNPSLNICPLKNGYHPLPGCVNVYYCSLKVTNLTAPSGYLFNPATRSLVLSQNFKCPF